MDLGQANVITWFIVIVILIVFAVVILNMYNFFDKSTGISRAKQANKQAKGLQHKIQRMLNLMAFFSKFCQNFGNGITENIEYEWNFRIERVVPDLPYLNRKITPLEIHGIFRLFGVVSCSFGVFLLIVCKSLLGGLIFISAGAFLGKIVQLILDLLVDAYDKELERDFPNLYLLLYCRLINGVNAKLGPVLLDYTRSMNAVYLPNEHKQIRQFVMDMRNSFEVYGDESTALTELKKKYRSATMLNFLNLAIQALRGTNNADRLLSFKVELQNRETQQMIAEAQKRADKARSAVNVVFVILFEFILISIASKMPSLSSMFSMF